MKPMSIAAKRDGKKTMSASAKSANVGSVSSSATKHPLWHHADLDCNRCYAKRIHARNKKTGHYADLAKEDFVKCTHPSYCMYCHDNKCKYYIVCCRGILFAGRVAYCSLVEWHIVRHGGILFANGVAYCSLRWHIVRCRGILFAVVAYCSLLWHIVRCCGILFAMVAYCTLTFCVAV